MNIKTHQVYTISNTAFKEYVSENRIQDLITNTIYSSAKLEKSFIGRPKASLHIKKFIKFSTSDWVSKQPIHMEREDQEKQE
jgi:hypothetical protein